MATYEEAAATGPRAMIKPVRFILVLIAAMSTQSCYFPRTAETPIPSQFYLVSEAPTDCLIVFLSGRGDSVDVFEKAGFIDAMRASATKANALAVDAHLGYYISGQLAERVQTDVLELYKQKGYRRFLLVGTSLGGYGSLWIWDAAENWIEGAVLLAPYLGPDDVIEAVQRSNSLAEWEESLGYEPTEDEYAWIWLRNLLESDRELDRRLLIAVGEMDKFRTGAGIIGDLLPESQVFLAAGGHDWQTWLELWRAVLESAAWAEMIQVTN